MEACVLQKWIKTKLGQKYPLLFPNSGSWLKVPEIEYSDVLPKGCKGVIRNKVLGTNVPDTLILNNAHILGGICSLFPGDYSTVRKIRDIEEFDNWLKSWYPRIDQIHDSVALISPRVKSVTYVVEDSIFSRRISKWTGINAVELAKSLKQIHENRGKKILRNWFRNFGYKGPVNVVYTSEIEEQLDYGVLYLADLAGIKPFKNSGIDIAKVKLMYTGFWARVVLGIKDPVIISEPAPHWWLEDCFDLELFFKQNPYGVNYGVNRNLYYVGFLPFWSDTGFSRFCSFDQVPNFSNFESWNPKSIWDTVNLQFGLLKVRENGPSISRKYSENIKADLKDIYSI
jgi:hypothetical protein